MDTTAVTLQDKYRLDSGRVFVTGTQALLRLAMVQRRRDAAAGLNTAGFISGYRGSPMTAIDVELWRAKAQTEKDHIRFWPATNEHMAATALWGTQQVHYYNDANYDGVFGMWYGKGPGLDQSLDAMRHRYRGPLPAVGQAIPVLYRCHSLLISTSVLIRSSGRFVGVRSVLIGLAGVRTCPAVLRTKS